MGKNCMVWFGLSTASLLVWSARTCLLVAGDEAKALEKKDLWWSAIVWLRPSIILRRKFLSCWETHSAVLVLLASYAFGWMQMRFCNFDSTPSSKPLQMWETCCYVCMELFRIQYKVIVSGEEVCVFWRGEGGCISYSLSSPPPLLLLLIKP